VKLEEGNVQQRGEFCQAGAQDLALEEERKMVYIYIYIYIYIYFFFFFELLGMVLKMCGPGHIPAVSLSNLG
jgi:hypothetical protein